MSRPTYDELLDEVLVLRSRLAQLCSVEPADILTKNTSLTPQESRVLLSLIDRPVASRDFIYAAAMERDNGEGPITKAVDVVVCRVRRKLKDLGVSGTLRNVYGVGYTLSDDAKAWVRQQVAPDLGVAA